MTGPTYTEEEIKTAIREELEAENMMGVEKEMYYTIIGVLCAALKRYDDSRRNITTVA